MSHDQCLAFRENATILQIILFLFSITSSVCYLITHDDIFGWLTYASFMAFFILSCVLLFVYDGMT